MDNVLNLVPNYPVKPGDQTKPYTFPLLLFELPGQNDQIEKLFELSK